MIMFSDTPKCRSDWKKVPQAFPQPRDPAKAGLEVNPSCDFTQAGRLRYSGFLKKLIAVVFNDTPKCRSCLKN